MKSPLPYIYDFLTFVFDHNESRTYIRSVILFGSVATGEYDEKSDVDLFIDVPEDAAAKVERIVRESEKRFYQIAERKWAVMGVQLPIRCIVGSLDSYVWKEVKSDIISTGLSLYGKYRGVKEGLDHCSLFSYDLSKISNKKKVSFIRSLFGYSQKRGSREYRTEGYLKDLGGSKLGRNALLIPVEKSRALQKFFSSYAITPEIREVWVARG